MKDKKYLCPLCGMEVEGFKDGSFIWIQCEECGGALAFNQKRIEEGRWSSEEAGKMLKTIQASQKKFYDELWEKKTTLLQ